VPADCAAGKQESGETNRKLSYLFREASLGSPQRQDLKVRSRRPTY
jgi:hypothetical protein